MADQLPFIVHGSRSRLARRLRLLSKFPRVDFHDIRGRLPWKGNIFLAYPDTVSDGPDKYEKMVQLFRGNKFEQWQMLKEYFLCPKVGDPPYVVRPLRHEGGEGFEITRTLPPDSKKATHYWRSLWPRSAEYRVLFVYGKPVLTLLKKVPEGTSQEIPWNAGVSSFVTVHERDNDRLRHTKFYSRAEAFFKDFPYHFCAVDVLYNDCSHRVVEVNFSPGVLISENLHLISQKLLEPYHAKARLTNRAALRAGVPRTFFRGLAPAESVR